VTVAYYVRNDGVLIRSVDRNRATRTTTSAGDLFGRTPDPQFLSNFDMATSDDAYDGTINPTGPDIRRQDFELARHVRWSPIVGVNPPAGFFVSFADPNLASPAYPENVILRRYGFARSGEALPTPDDWTDADQSGVSWKSVPGAPANPSQDNHLPLAVSVHLRLFDDKAAASWDPLTGSVKTDGDADVVENRTKSFHTVIWLPRAAQ